MFLSVIVPCHNPGRYIATLLDSLVHQPNRDSIEAILVDDGSSESYDHVIAPFLGQLRIRRAVMERRVGFPGPVRNVGVAMAEGDWICFADQDDAFFYNSLGATEEKIAEAPERLYCIGDFAEANLGEGGILAMRCREHATNHGKLYHREGLWNRYGLSFMHDMAYCEDTYISTKLQAICISEGIEPLYTDIPTYVWYLHPDQTTQSGTYLHDSIRDWIRGTGDTVIEAHESGLLTLRKARTWTAQILGSLYFYVNQFAWNDRFGEGPGYDAETRRSAREFVGRAKRRLGCGTEDFMRLLADGGPGEMGYKDTCDISMGGNLRFVPLFTFEEFLEDAGEGVLGRASSARFYARRPVNARASWPKPTPPAR